MNVAVLIPARDEEEALPPLLDRLADVSLVPPARLRVLVVDNGSRDATAAVARAAGARVVTEPRAGYGRACLTGIEILRGDRPPPDVLVFMDADDERAPAQLPRLLAPLRAGRADLVVGERRASGRPGVRWHAALGNRLVCGFLRGAYGSRVRDMGPFRAVRYEGLLELGLDDPDYGWYVQMQVRALRSGHGVASVPVAFARRTRGRSKVSGSLGGSVAAARVMVRTLAEEVLRSPPDRRPYRSPAAPDAGGGAQSRTEARS